MSHRTLQSAAFVLAAIVTLGIAGQAHAVTYQLLNHPDGAAITSGKTVDEDGYVLRLDKGSKVHTFNANHTELTISFNPGGTTAAVSGLVTHNESGWKTNRYDSKDDVYEINGTLAGVLLTDSFGSAGNEWFGDNSHLKTYDDMFGDLLADANDPNRWEEYNKDFSYDTARIYFAWQDLSIEPVTLNGLGHTYNGPTSWTNFGPPLYIQYNWRLWDNDLDALAGAGWLTATGDSNTPGTQDWLFTLGSRLDDKPGGDPGDGGVVPEPATASLAMMGLGALAMSLRRRRMAA